eukprot:4896556-Prymnesium_polylepis.1
MGREDLMLAHARARRCAARRRRVLGAAAGMAHHRVCDGGRSRQSRRPLHSRRVPAVTRGCGRRAHLGTRWQRNWRWRSSSPSPSAHVCSARVSGEHSTSSARTICATPPSTPLPTPPPPLPPPPPPPPPLPPSSSAARTARASASACCSPCALSGWSTWEYMDARSMAACARFHRLSPCRTAYSTLRRG